MTTSSLLLIIMRAAAFDSLIGMDSNSYLYPKLALHRVVSTVSSLGTLEVTFSVTNETASLLVPTWLSSVPSLGTLEVTFNVIIDTAFLPIPT